MRCQLTTLHRCPDGREATIHVTWTMIGDPDPAECVSVLCDGCFAERPAIIRVISTRKVREGDALSV